MMVILESTWQLQLILSFIWGGPDQKCESSHFFFWVRRSLIKNSQNPFHLQKRLENDPKISNFSKFPYYLKNFSRNCGGHYNVKIKHF